MYLCITYVSLYVSLHFPTASKTPTRNNGGGDTDDDIESHSRKVLQKDKNTVVSAV